MPLRAVLGWMLLLPLPALGGLAGIHALLFWVLAMGTGFANKVGLAGIESTTANGFVANAATLTAEPADLEAHGDLLPLLEQKVGRVLFNGYPTGVEVCDAMVHGGPYPATSDARGTSVGSLAIDRFLRPVCYQNCPDALLPDALKNANPLGLARLVDGITTRESLD